MLRRSALVLALLPLVAGCAAGGAEDADPPSAGGSSSNAPSWSPSTTGPSPEERWAQALAERSEPIGFEAELLVEAEEGQWVPFVSTRGSWSSGPDVWSATTTATDPVSGEAQEFELRSRRGLTWMSAPGSAGPLADRWLVMGRGQVPAEQLAMTVGEPRYLAVLDEVDDVSALDADDVGPGSLEGTISLSEALELLMGSFVERLGYRDPSTARGEVEIVIDLVGSSVEGYRIRGADLLSAIRDDSHVDIDAETVALVEHLAVEVDLERDAEAPDATPPDPATVITAEDLPSST